MSLEFSQNCFLFLSFHLDFSVPEHFQYNFFHHIEVRFHSGVGYTHDLKNQGPSMDPSLLFSCRTLYHVKLNKPLKITVTWLTQLIGWLYVCMFSLCNNYMSLCQLIFLFFIYSLCMLFLYSHSIFHFTFAYHLLWQKWADESHSGRK